LENHLFSLIPSFAFSLILEENWAGYLFGNGIYLDSEAFSTFATCAKNLGGRICSHGVFIQKWHYRCFNFYAALIKSGKITIKQNKK